MISLQNLQALLNWNKKNISCLVFLVPSHRLEPRTYWLQISCSSLTSKSDVLYPGCDASVVSFFGRMGFNGKDMILAFSHGLNKLGNKFNNFESAINFAMKIFKDKRKSKFFGGNCKNLKWHDKKISKKNLSKNIKDLKWVLK